LEDEENRRMAEEDEAARLAEEIAEAERRRLRLLAMGKKKYLRKGEGTSAASQTARTQGDKDRDERTKYGGLARPFDYSKGGGQEQEQPKMMLLEVDAEMDENWDQCWDKEKFEKFEQMRTDLLNKASSSVNTDTITNDTNTHTKTDDAGGGT
jgi:hypothetical protein